MACTQHLGFSDLPTIYNITYPVGPNRPNVRDDVLLIQTLLRLANFARDITVDGLFGAQTEKMIEAFEACVRGKHLMLAADGIFEPSSNNGYTPEGVIYKIIHLNRLAKQTAAFGLSYNEIPTDPETHPVLRRSLVDSERLQLAHAFPMKSDLR